MRGGHNIKTVEELKENGTYQAAYHANRFTLPPVQAVPDPPDYFDERHAIKWNDVCRQLVEAEIIANQDFDAIVIYVKTWLMADDAFSDIQKNGMTIWVETKAGTKPVTNPAFRQYTDCQRILKPLMEQFGFTPRARMGMKMEKPKPKEVDPLDFLDN